MGRKCTQNKVNHLISKIEINKANCCKNCSLRLYAKNDDKITFGIGNIYTNTILILPSYDVNLGEESNSMLSIIKDNYTKITGRNIFEDCYVTRYIKCFNKTDFNLNDDAIKYCVHHLIYEINRIRPRKIITFGDKYEEYIQNDYIPIFNVINPAVMFYDNENLKNKFIEQFKIAILS